MWNIVYRTGGTHHCSWHRVFTNYATEEAAKIAAFDLIHMGYKCIVQPVSVIETVGLPIGWEYDSVDEDFDEVEVTKFTTRHIRKL